MKVNHIALSIGIFQRPLTEYDKKVSFFNYKVMVFVATFSSGLVCNIHENGCIKIYLHQTSVLMLKCHKNLYFDSFSFFYINVIDVDQNMLSSCRLYAADDSIPYIYADKNLLYDCLLKITPNKIKAVNVTANRDIFCVNSIHNSSGKGSFGAIALVYYIKNKMLQYFLK